MKRLLLEYIPLTLWAAGVLLVGGLDFGDAALPRDFDKVGHFLAYGVGGALAAAAGRWARRGSGWPGLAIVAGVAAVDEVRQAGLAYRSGDPLDWLADMAGALVFFLVVRRVYGRDAGGT